MVPFVKAESTPLGKAAPGYRLRRDALRILAQKFEGRALSPTEAENLLANHHTLKGSLDAVKRLRTRELQSRPGQFDTEVGTLQPLWLVRAAAAVELILAGLFLNQIR